MTKNSLCYIDIKNKIMFFIYIIYANFVCNNFVGCPLVFISIVTFGCNIQTKLTKNKLHNCYSFFVLVVVFQ